MKAADVSTGYESIIGLEIHAELKTNSKMFCSCRVVDSVTASPNTAVCPVCLGMPGMLPVINRRAIDFAIRVSLALHCTIQPHNVFARKSYFYPDLPKNFQISQYELPIGRAGWLDIPLDSGETRRIGIRRVHMEEDTGKLTHLGDGRSLVDFNRSGVPLLEIVTEPDLRSGHEARTYAIQVRQILRYLDVNSGDMEKGVLRIEPNISIRPVGSDALGNRVELKNLNSFRALADGTDFELERQAAVLNNDGEIVQETRGWRESARETFSQRIKEESEDYRYFTEPDLPPLFIDKAWIETEAKTLPELPDAKVQRYTEGYSLSAYDASVIAEDRAVAEWYDAAVAGGGDPKGVANWLINEVFRLMNESSQPIDQLALTPAGLVELLVMLDEQTISSGIAKEVLAEMVTNGRSAPAIVEERGLAQISDEEALATIVENVLVDNPDNLASYLAGKEGLKGWFIGQVMARTQGKANPSLVSKLVHEQLATLKGQADN